MDKALEHRDALMGHLQERWSDLFGAECQILLYDLTSTSFEGEAKSVDGAARGYSRDHRPDTLQVLVALVMTPEGFPVACEVFDGDTADWSKRTRNNYVSTLSTLFIFAGDRDYCLGNPAEKIPRAILDDGTPGILTVEQVAKLLKITRKEDLGMLAYVAIGLFAGPRRSELCALEWSEIDVEARTIEVKGAKAKTRQRRIVTISETLAEWLALVPKSVHPAASRNEDVCSERLKNLYSERLDQRGSLICKAIVDSWPHNALRHSFGSYHYAQYRDENRTTAEMGNSPAVVFRHYRALVKREAADAFWMLRPI